MPDTLVDPPQTPTLPDGPTGEPPLDPADDNEPAEPLPETVTARPRGRACVVVAVLLTLGALLGALAFYFLVWRGSADARAHVPDRSTFVARLDARDFALFAPVRKHLWPLIVGDPQGPPPRPAAPSDKPSRAERVRKATGISATDVRDVVVASTDSKSWVVLVGGNIRRGKAVAGLAEVIKEEGLPGWAVVEEMLVGPRGLTVAQADDGTLIFATDREIARAALPATDQWQELEVPAAPGAFVLGADAWRAFSSMLASAPRADVLARIQHGAGTLRLGDAPELELRLRPAATDAATVASDLDGLLATLRLGLLLAPDRYGEKQALSSGEGDHRGRQRAGASAVAHRRHRSRVSGARRAPARRTSAFALSRMGERCGARWPSAPRG